MNEREELAALRRMAELEDKAAGVSAEPTFADKAGRVAGLGARAAIRGVTALPTLAAEAVAYPLRAATGGKYFQSPSAVLERTMTEAGLPEPETRAERIGTNVAGSIAGMGTQLGALSQIPGQLARTLTQQPARQLVAAGTGSAAASVAGEAGAGPLGQFAAGAAGSMLPFAPQIVRGAPTPEQLRTAQTAKSGQKAGFVLPPATSRPTIVNKLAEGLSGKITTAQAASSKNQVVTDSLVKKDFGIPKSEAITSDRLAAIRTAAGRDYQNIANFGKFRTDPQFAQDLQNISATSQVLSQEIPEMANKSILGLVKSLNKPEFSGRTIVELTKKLRESATAAFKSGDTESGRFYRGAADAVEDMVERNLQAAGQADMLNRFRVSRQTIAKAHTAEAALNDATGNISARKLAAQFDKGKPLSGGMRQVAEFSSAFPKATQAVEGIGSQPGISPLDYFGGMTAGGLGSIATGSPAGLAFGLYPLIRPATRSMILSRPYQATLGAPQVNAMPRSEAGLLGLLPNLQQPKP